jgi:hypothetical protein
MRSRRRIKSAPTRVLRTINSRAYCDKQEQQEGRKREEGISGPSERMDGIVGAQNSKTMKIV